MRWQEVTHIFHEYLAVVVFETDDQEVHHLQGTVVCTRRGIRALLQTRADFICDIPPYAHVIKLERVS